MQLRQVDDFHQQTVVFQASLEDRERLGSLGFRLDPREYNSHVFLQQDQNWTNSNHNK
jgi:hypothetical protein